ncbi:hypothetical protein SAMN03097699_0708 [Flavobacteriaceae bacterium MAR_2010_188]|nr:hypothetical protein SAMN03097699_0708 [Flavobacteriaceae bacterium MAR_2010_188]
MTKYCSWIATLMVFMLLASCSNDDMGDSSNKDEETFPDILVISETDGTIYQHNIYNNGENKIDFNLTAELNLIDDEYFFIQHNDLINLVSRADVNYKVSQKNVVNSEILMLSYICDLEENEFGIRPIITNSRVAMVTIKDLISEGLFKIKSYDTKSRICEEINLGNAEVVGSVIVRDENVFLTQVENGNTYKISKIDLTTMTVAKAIDFSNVFKASEKDGKLYVFFQDNSYEIYDSNTFEEIGSSYLNFGLLPDGLGLFDIQLEGNILGIDIDYIQPSIIEVGPGTVNLETGEVINGEDFFALELSHILSYNYNANIKMTAFVQDLESGLVIYGFDIGDEGGKGGIIYTNYQNEILKLVELNSVPDRIVIRN